MVSIPKGLVRIDTRVLYGHSSAATIIGSMAICNTMVLTILLVVGTTGIDNTRSTVYHLVWQYHCTNWYTCVRTYVMCTNMEYQWNITSSQKVPWYLVHV